MPEIKYSRTYSQLSISVQRPLEDNTTYEDLQNVTGLLFWK